MFLIVMVPVGVVKAETARWLLPESGDWFDTANWSPITHAYPDENLALGASYEVVIDTPSVAAYTVSLEGDVQVSELLLDAEAARLVVETPSGEPNRSALSVEGLLDIQNGRVVLKRGILSAGSLNVGPGGSFDIFESVEFRVAGRVDGTVSVNRWGWMYLGNDMTDFYGAIELAERGGLNFWEATRLDGDVDISGAGKINGDHITLGPGVTVLGGSGKRFEIGIGGFNAPERVVNEGVLNAVDQDIAVTGSEILNLGRIEIGNGDTFEVKGKWENQGVVNMAEGSTLYLRGDIDVTKIGVMNRSGGAVLLGGLADNAGHVIDENTFSGAFTLGRKGRVEGGVIEGVDFTLEGGSSLKGVTVNEGVDSVLSFGPLNGEGRAVLEDVILNIDSPRTTFEMLGNVEINQSMGLGSIYGAGWLGGSGVIATYKTQGNDAKIVSTGVLTFGADLEILAHDGGLTIDTRGGGVVNYADIRIDNPEYLLLVLGSDFENAGLIEVTGGAKFEMSFLEEGPDPGRVSVVDSSVDFTMRNTTAKSFSEISLVNSSMTFEGDLTSDQLFSMAFDGASIKMKGTLDNTGRDFDFGIAGVSFDQRDTTVHGGRIVNTTKLGVTTLNGHYNDVTIALYPEFAGATLSGEINFDNLGPAVTGHAVVRSLVVNNASLTSSEELEISVHSATISVIGGMNIGPNVVLLNSGSNVSRLLGGVVTNHGLIGKYSGRLEITSAIENHGDIRASWDRIVIEGNMDNQGLIQSNGQYIGLLGDKYRNTGTLRIVGDGEIRIAAGHTFAPIYYLGDIENPSGTLSFDGHLDMRGGVLNTDDTGKIQAMSNAIFEDLILVGDPANEFLIYNSTFDGVAIERDVSIDGAVFRGQTVLNGAAVGRGSIYSDGIILGEGTFTSQGGQMRFIPINESLTLGADLTFRNVDGGMTFGKNESQTVINSPIYSSDRLVEFLGEVDLNNLVEVIGPGRVIISSNSNHDDGFLRAVSGGKITLFGNYTTPELGNHEIDGGRLVVNGSLDNTGYTLTATGVGSSYGIEGQTPLTGGVIRLEDGASVWMGREIGGGGLGTLDGVSYEGVLRIEGDGASVDIVNTPLIDSDLFIENTNVNIFDSNVTGNVHVTAGQFYSTNTPVGGDIFAMDSTVVFEATERIDYGSTIHLDASEDRLSKLIFAGEVDTVLGPNMTVRGGDSIIESSVRAIAVINEGTIISDVPGEVMRLYGHSAGGLVNEGLIRVTNEGEVVMGRWKIRSNYYITGYFTNGTSGVMEVSDGGKLSLSYWDNDGTVRSFDGGILSVSTTGSVNNGIIEATDSFVTITGNYEANLGEYFNVTNSEFVVSVPMTMDRLREIQGVGNDIFIADTIDNTDRVMTFGSVDENTWFMGDRGEIVGGRVEHSGSEPIRLSAPTYGRPQPFSYSPFPPGRYDDYFILDGVHLDADVVLEPREGTLRIANGITFESGRTITVNSSSIILKGTQTIEGEGTIILTQKDPFYDPQYANLYFDTLNNSNSVLTLGPDLTIVVENNNSKIGGYAGYSDVEGHLINQGKIHVNAPGYSFGLYGKTVTNEGEVLVEDGMFVEFRNAYVQTRGVTRLGDTILTLGEPLVLQGGVLEVRGEVDGAIDNAGGMMSLGDKTGAIRMTSNFTQREGASLDLVIDGANPGRYDQIVSAGVLVLGGELNLDLAGIPGRDFLMHVRPTDVLSILSGAGVSGGFSNARSGSRVELAGGALSFLISYGDGSTFDPNSVVLSDAIAFGQEARRSLVWQGDVGGAKRSWIGGATGDETNWKAAGELNPDDQVKPTHWDTVVFNDAAMVVGDLRLDGVVEVEGVVIEAVDYGVTRRDFATPGAGGVGVSWLKLGVGGIEANMLGLQSEKANRNVAIGANIELEWDTVIRRKGAYAAPLDQRRLYIEGVVSGDFDLEIDNEVPTNANSTIQLNQNNTFRGMLTVNGSTIFANSSGFGDDSNPVFTATKRSTEIRMIAVDEAHTYNPFILGESGLTRFFRNSAGDWYLHGDLTSKVSEQELQFRSTGTSRIILDGANQDFDRDVRMFMGTELVIAAGNKFGEVWENAAAIQVNTNPSNNNRSNSFLLAGNLELRTNYDVEGGDRVVLLDINEKGGDGNRAAVTQMGQTNLNGEPSIARFDRVIEVQEDDYLALQLTADAGSHAIFREPVTVAGGEFGFEKVGLGTVHLPYGAYGLDENDEYPMGPVYVREGQLDLGSRTSALNATKIVVDKGAELNGFNELYGDLDLSGTLTIGAADLHSPYLSGFVEDVLSLAGDAVFREHSIWEIDVAAEEHDFFSVSGTLDLGERVASLVIHVDESFEAELGDRFLIAQGNWITGEFLDFSGGDFGNGLQLVPVLERDGGSLEFLHNGGSLDYLHLEVAAIPTPSSFAILALGMIGVARRRRRAA